MKPLVWFKRWDDGDAHWLCRIPGQLGFGIGDTPIAAFTNWEKMRK